MKLKAFTILEMIINLALMSIIVSIVYVVYGYFSKNLSQYSEMTAENFELESFNIRMKEDFYKADKILLINKNDLKIVFYDETYVEYIKQDKYLYRKSGRIMDSIRISGIQVSSIPMKLPDNAEVLVQNVFVQADLFGKTAPLFVYKNYYSNYLILRE